MRASDVLGRRAIDRTGRDLGRIVDIVCETDDQGRPELVYVRPVVERNATFRVERVRKYADDGYRAAREALTRWRGSH